MDRVMEFLPFLIPLVIAEFHCWVIHCITF